jgi:hypothetical protein
MTFTAILTRNDNDKPHVYRGEDPSHLKKHVLAVAGTNLGLYNGAAWHIMNESMEIVDWDLVDIR